MGCGAAGELDGMRILIVATKSPWPPRDGGRLALWLTMQGLAAAGHALCLVAPVDDDEQARALQEAPELRSVCEVCPVVAGKRNWGSALSRALVDGRALTVARHALPQVSRAVARCVDSWRPELVHMEQLQALANCDAAVVAGIPRVLRMQNVESALWAQVARARPWSLPLRMEAWRLRRDEVRALRSATRVVALTGRDAEQLRGLAPAAAETTVTAIAPPFPARWPSADAVCGEPAIVVFGSGGWWPNEDGLRWFMAAVMPLLRLRLPAARVHVYGGEPRPHAQVEWHAAPVDAIEAFPTGAIVALPLFIGSGIRMRILEAWSRGLPVVATPVAAAGLEVADGRELLIAADADAFAQALATLSRESALRARLVDAGRAYLQRQHDPALRTAALCALYAEACAQHPTSAAEPP